MVVSELRGEKIDIIPWNTEPARFVAKALSPGRVREVYIDDESSDATVVVPDDQLALAIGKEGLNARLAARLTGWKVDIKSDTEFAQEEAEAAFAGEDDGRISPAAARRSSRTASAVRTRLCPAPASAACPPTSELADREARGRGRQPQRRPADGGRRGRGRGGREETGEAEDVVEALASADELAERAPLADATGAPEPGDEEETLPAA